MVMLRRLTGIGGGIEIHKTPLEELTLVYEADIRLAGKVGESRLQNYSSVLVEYLERTKSRGPIGPYGQESPKPPDTNIPANIFSILSYKEIYYLQNGLRVEVPLIRMATDKLTKLEFGFEEDEESELTLRTRGHLNEIKEFAKFISQSYVGKTRLSINEVYMEVPK